MRVPKLGMAALALIGGVSLGGCAYDMYGDGYGGYGYGPYSGVSVGVGYGGGYGYSPYYSGYGYSPYSYGGYYGSPFGWYDDFYYPGTGIYVYDSYRRPRVWNDTQRRYWTQRSGTWRSHNNGGTWTNTNTSTRPNWSGFDHHDRSGISIRQPRNGHR